MYLLIYFLTVQEKLIAIWYRARHIFSTSLCKQKELIDFAVIGADVKVQTMSSAWLWYLVQNNVSDDSMTLCASNSVSIMRWLLLIICWPSLHCKLNKNWLLKTIFIDIENESMLLLYSCCLILMYLFEHSLKIVELFYVFEIVIIRSETWIFTITTVMSLCQTCRLFNQHRRACSCTLLWY